MTIQLRKKALLTITALLAFIASSYSAQAQDGLRYRPVTPCRIVDTRKSVIPGRVLANQAIQYHVYGSGSQAGRIANQGGNVNGCPAPRPKPLAVHINIISARQTGNGNLVAFPAGQAIPDATLINYKQGVNISNAAVVKTCPSCPLESSISVASGVSATHVIIDVLGYYFSF